MGAINFEDIEPAIFSTFAGSPQGWRTVEGISRDTGYSIPDVTNFINEHSNMFQQSSLSPAGSNLYRPKPEFFAYGGQ